MTTKNQIDIESAKTYLEKIMMELPSNKSRNEHRMYLCGVIDTLKDVGKISDEIRGTLYAEFGF